MAKSSSASGKESAVYALRNLIYRTGAGQTDFYGSAVKFNYPEASDGVVHLFHNTTDGVLARTNAFAAGSEGTWPRIVSRNNVWAASGHAVERTQPLQDLDLDYDALFRSSPGPLAWWAGIQDPALATLGHLQQAVGQEIHGIEGVPAFVQPAVGDYRLRGTSPLIDAGVSLPGINDLHRGSAPDIGAFEWQPPLFADGFESGDLSAW